MLDTICLGNDSNRIDVLPDHYAEAAECLSSADADALLADILAYEQCDVVSEAIQGMLMRAECLAAADRILAKY